MPADNRQKLPEKGHSSRLPVQYRREVTVKDDGGVGVNTSDDSVTSSDKSPTIVSHLIFSKRFTSRVNNQGEVRVGYSNSSPPVLERHIGDQIEARKSYNVGESKPIFNLLEPSYSVQAPSVTEKLNGQDKSKVSFDLKTQAPSVKEKSGEATQEGSSILSSLATFFTKKKPKPSRVKSGKSLWKRSVDMAVQTSVTEMGRFAEVLEKLVKTVGSLQKITEGMARSIGQRQGPIKDAGEISQGSTLGDGSLVFDNSLDFSTFKIRFDGDASDISILRNDPQFGNKLNSSPGKENIRGSNSTKESSTQDDTYTSFRNAADSISYKGKLSKLTEESSTQDENLRIFSSIKNNSGSESGGKGTSVKEISTQDETRPTFTSMKNNAGSEIRSGGTSAKDSSTQEETYTPNTNAADYIFYKGKLNELKQESSTQDKKLPTFLSMKNNGDSESGNEGTSVKEISTQDKYLPAFSSFKNNRGSEIGSGGISVQESSTQHENLPTFWNIKNNGGSESESGGTSVKESSTQGERLRTFSSMKNNGGSESGSVRTSVKDSSTQDDIPSSMTFKDDDENLPAFSSINNGGSENGRGKTSVKDSSTQDENHPTISGKKHSAGSDSASESVGTSVRDSSTQDETLRTFSSMKNNGGSESGSGVTSVKDSSTQEESCTSFRNAAESLFYKGKLSRLTQESSAQNENLSKFSSKKRTGSDSANKSERTSFRDNSTQYEIVPTFSSKKLSAGSDSASESGNRRCQNAQFYYYIPTCNCGNQHSTSDKDQSLGYSVLSPKTPSLQEAFQRHIAYQQRAQMRQRSGSSSLAYQEQEDLRAQLPISSRNKRPSTAPQERRPSQCDSNNSNNITRHCQSIVASLNQNSAEPITYVIPKDRMQCYWYCL